jgi:transcriptional regulator with GAF, ATPase, and Fis domain
MDLTHDIVGESPAHRRVLRSARLVAPTGASVLLRGESGTGKELVAMLIHQESGRSGAFVPVNCAALPEALVESLLFGHRRGAFTGASEASVGLVASADGGTLFLDEVAELPLPAQAKLLRVLQQGSILPVGETRERPVDVRIVAASHRDLRAAVTEGRFREDLFFRLAKFELELAPLRERGRDVVLIARSYLEHAPDLRSRVRLSRSAEGELLRYPWLGNVRELQNVLFRLALQVDALITAQHVRTALDLAPVGIEPAAQVLETVEQLGEASCAELATTLGIPRSTLKDHVRQLVGAGELVAVGRGRATRYRRPGPAGEPLDQRAHSALAIAQRDGRVTRATLAYEQRLSLRTAGRVLAQLVEGGRLVSDGRQGSAAGYVLPERVST